MLTRQEKAKLRLKASSLKRNEQLLRKQHQKNKPIDNTSEAEDNSQSYRYMRLGFEFVISILIFLLGGYYLDKAFTVSPLFLFLGLMIGFSLGLYQLVNVTKNK